MLRYAQDDTVGFCVALDAALSAMYRSGMDNLVQTAKPQHRRASTGKSALKTAPVLDF